ncbi:DUF885 domain-containing protein [Aliikangiella sp. IMCC44359]|uniref:DUF885 domain-containing protein n=1 Tax=Aliikangiella sp. IMCC44359 TaxID=3459125 RepID=UPI00403AF9BC
MKKILIWFLSIITVLLLIVSGFLLYEWNAKPLFINNFFNRFALKLVLEKPETLTSLHFLEPWGIRGHNTELDDVSPESTEAFFKYIAEEYKVLKTYNEDELQPDELMSKRIAEYLFQLAEEAEPFKFHNYPINQLFGVQNAFPTFMESQHQINDLRDAQDYVARLSKIKLKFLQAARGVKLRAESGIVPPRFVINRVIEEMSQFTSIDVEENILYKSLQDKLNQLGTIDEQLSQSLLNDAKTAIEKDVYPAYHSLSESLKVLIDKGDDRDGYWKLPDGDKAYHLALKIFTSTDYTPDYIHHVGLNEVARIQQQITEILVGEGHDTSGSFYNNISRFAQQESFYYEDSHDGRLQILADYQNIIDEIQSNMGDAFNIRAKAKVKVERIPVFKEKTSPGAYYNPPAIDGSRPGVFYANLYDIKATPKYSMRTLAYHEAIPGHHFQVSIAQELENMPLFRKFAPFTAYSEGWALYAERLAWELGFLSDPYDNIGRLQAELFRAVRLVVDTGIHAKKWSRNEAIDYMIKNTGMAESDVIAEVERYIVMPGQACAYKIGMMKILELRAKSQKSLGERFKLSEFHAVILQNGAVPLDILEELVEQYINKKLN